MEALLGRIALGWIRHGVGMFGAYMLAHGYWTSSQSAQATGALITLIPLLFSAIDKFEAESAKNKALLKAAQQMNLQPSSSEQLEK